MSRHTQAEIFIRTLTEMRDDERASLTDRLRNLRKAYAERFTRAGRDDPVQPAERALRSRQMA